MAILLTADMQNSLDLLLQFRYIGDIDQANKFMFPKSGQSLDCLRGSDAMRYVAMSASISRPELITSKVLRKHVATISQLLNLSTNELDILADFLGHDVRIHRNFYRLSEDTLQMAKVSKILVAMERGNIQHFKGKSLDEIQFDVNEQIEEDEEVEEDEKEENASSEDEFELSLPAASFARRETPTLTDNTKARKQYKKQPWNAAEKNVVIKYFQGEIKLKKEPKKGKCEECISQHTVLRNRSWKQIKYFVYNYFKKEQM